MAHRISMLPFFLVFVFLLRLNALHHHIVAHYAASVQEKVIHIYDNKNNNNNNNKNKLSQIQCTPFLLTTAICFYFSEGGKMCFGFKGY